MRDINWAVVIYGINAGGPDEDKGLYDTGTQLDFKWVYKGAHTNYKEGILLENWSSGFSKNVDIRRQGKYASIGGGKVNVDNTTGLYIWIKQNGINLTGKRIQLIEIDLTNPLSPVETPLYTGVVGQSLTHDAKTLSIPFEDISRYRNAKITDAIPGKDNQYYPAVFGEVDKTKFVNKTDTVEEYLFNNNVVIFQYNAGSNTTTLALTSSINLTTLEINDLNSSCLLGNIYVKCEAGSGEGVIRRVATVQDIGSSQIVANLSESLQGVGGVPDDLIADDSYFKFYTIEYVNFADYWINCQGFQDSDLYTYPNNTYVDIPILNGIFSKTNNSIELISNDLKDWGKITGYKIIAPTSVSSGISAISDPTDLSGITGTWNYYAGSKAWANDLGGIDAGVPNDSAITDFDNSTYSLIDIDISSFDFYVMSVHKLVFELIEADTYYIGISLKGKEPKGNGLIGTIRHHIYNNFENSDVSYNYQTSGFLDYVIFFNYDQDAIENYTPPVPLNKNDAWWSYNSPLLIGSENWYTGFNLMELDFGSNPLNKINNEIYISNIARSFAPGGFARIVLENIQYSIIAKMSDIDFTKGIYAKWWGRNYDTVDFGLDPDNLMIFGNDIYNHICRLQNFESDDITSPSEGWGKVYISNYTGLIDNTTSYGGLQYAELDLYPLCSRQVNTSSELDTKKLKETLLKDCWAFGSIDSDGKEKLFSMNKAFDSGMTRVSISYQDYAGNPNLTDRPTTDIFTQPYVLYDWDEASQKYLKEIRVSSTEQPSFLTSYVTGDITDGQKEVIWERAQSLYDNYEVINDCPESIVKLKWIKNTQVAYDFMLAWLKWMGGTSAGFKDRREVSFTVSYEFAVTNSLDLGTLIDIEIPFDDSTNTALGVITKVNHNLKAKSPECKITAFIEITIPRVFNNIVETGSRADNVLETGSRTDDIIESGNR